MKHLICSRPCLRITKVLLILFIASSCSSNKSNTFEIDPTTFVENKITLSQIANDITYIPLDDSIPFSLVYPTSINILKNSIYLSAKDIGIMRFNREGKMLKVIGKRGRGPGEWHYCMWVAVDDRTETIYVMDNNNEIKVYYKNGIFKETLHLPQSKDGFDFSGISFFNNKLFASQHINMGHAEYNWIILDTLGNILQRKYNSIPTFPCRLGAGGGTFKFEDKISYWNWFNDTIFTIYPDFTYKASYLFAQGENRLPTKELPFTSPNQFFELLAKYYTPENIIETKRYLLYHYWINNKGTIALIDKNSGKTYLTNQAKESDGIVNDIDGGLMFIPKRYFTEDNHEYLIGLTDPFQIKKHIESEDFKNSKPESLEKKTSLENLAKRLNETGNPILLIVKLKE